MTFDSQWAARVKRNAVAVNRIPPGYTIYPTMAGDDIINGVYGDGSKLVFTSTETKYMQMLNHFYAVGGMAIFETSALVDELDAWLMAPASTGLTETAGDFDKYALGGGLNMIIPAAPGQGAWSMDLAATLNANVGILAATPVPAAGNDGFFDYDPDENTLTVNANQEGSFNLYDFDVPLFKFCNRCSGVSGQIINIESADVVGKLLYNFWKIKFTMTKASAVLSTGVVMKLAVKQNV